MASGIAEVFAKAGHEVVLAARSEEKAQAAKARIGKSLSRSVDKGRMTVEAAAGTLDRITPAGTYDAFADVDLALEAVAEDLDVKRQLFTILDKVCKPGAILATTTSSLPVVACARATSRPQDVIGMHFFNPAPAMKLVEVVRTVLTGDDVHATVRGLCAAVRKHPVDCGDRAGFIVNALLFPYLNNAVKMVQDHYASLDDIDAAMKLGGGYPMGPFELLDVVGLDVSLAIERELYTEFREPGFAPAPLLEHLVTAGYLGRKTGRGFRDYAGS
jgi:3-hydroxybutyryl-CoA dehydrogenase